MWGYHDYNKETGIFKLTQSAASHWLRRSDIPEECKEFKGLQLACCILVHHDVEVVDYHGSWAEIRAGQAEIWEALSGQPADPGRDPLTGEVLVNKPRKPREIDDSGFPIFELTEYEEDFLEEAGYLCPTAKRRYGRFCSRLKTYVGNLRGWECEECSKSWDTKKQARNNLQLHHIVPRSSGGSDNLDNLQLLCYKCHQAKHSHTINKNYRPNLRP